MFKRFLLVALCAFLFAAEGFAAESKAQCRAVTLSGSQCKRKAAQGKSYCKQHAAEVEAKKTPEKCRAIDQSGKRCEARPLPKRNYCEKHSK